ncbi:MAG: methyltransferase regulatory domain-containing protein, partial [Anaerolineales bacterium]|nr:methyltransferase regulatory domain-containing protein [Anaerolineales bacterium]
CLDVRAAAEAGLGEFDYVIAHGLYSWIPADARDALLRVCRRSLAPHGIAYVSYNTYPGWHMLRGLREMMLFHTRSLADPAERAVQARGLVDFLAGAVAAEAQHGYGALVHAYKAFLDQERERLGEYHDGALLHDELEDINEPVYFHEFMAHAGRHDLLYLSEVDLRTVLLSNFPPAVGQALLGLARDLITLEQYMDFIRNRQFRQTLLCRAEVTLDRQLEAARVRRLYVAAPARPLSAAPDLAAGVVEKFHSPDEAQFATNHPLTKAALLALAAAWPAALSFEQVVAAARARLPAGAAALDPAEDEAVLCANLLQAHVYSRSLVELRAFQPALAVAPGAHPRVSAWTRLLTRTAAGAVVRVTNQRHERVELDPLARLVAARLDGAHDAAGIVDELLSGPLAAGQLALPEVDVRQGLTEPGRLRAYLAKEVDDCLHWLGRAGLLTP